MARPKAQVLIFISLLLPRRRRAAPWSRSSVSSFAANRRGSSRPLSFTDSLLARARRTWRNRLVASLGSDLQSFVVRKFHFDPAFFAVVIIVGRLVSDHVLVAQLPRNLGETFFKLDHLCGEESAPAGIFRQPLE